MSQQFAFLYIYRKHVVPITVVYALLQCIHVTYGQRNVPIIQVTADNRYCDDLFIIIYVRKMNNLNEKKS